MLMKFVFVSALSLFILESRDALAEPIQGLRNVPFCLSKPLAVKKTVVGDFYETPIAPKNSKSKFQCSVQSDRRFSKVEACPSASTGDKPETKKVWLGYEFGDPRDVVDGKGKIIANLSDFTECREKKGAKPPAGNRLQIRVQDPTTSSRFVGFVCTTKVKGADACNMQKEDFLAATGGALKIGAARFGIQPKKSTETGGRVPLPVPTSPKSGQGN